MEGLGVSDCICISFETSLTWGDCYDQCLETHDVIKLQLFINNNNVTILFQTKYKTVKCGKYEKYLLRFR